MKTELNRVSVTSHTRRAVALQLGAILTLGLLLSACNKQETKVTTGSDLTGVYNLASVDGKQVPATVSHEGAALQVRSGSLTINADGTCASKMVFVPPSGQETTHDVSATYTRDGSKLTMKWQGAGVTTGTLDGNTFTMNNEGMLFVYRK